VTDSRVCNECCRHTAELRQELTNARDVAQQLVGFLVEQAAPARMRAQLHVVGHPPVPEQPRRLAEVIEFPAPRVSSRPLRARRHASGS
jgi:hypothetical protein